MEQSILVAADGSPPDEDATVALAWHLVGPAAKAITLAALAAFVALTIAWSSRAPAAIATGLALGVITAAALVDAVDHRLPNGLVAMAAMPVGVATAITAAAGSLDVALGALAGAALLGVPLLITHLLSPVGMGFGDVKAGAVVGGAVGLVSAQLAVLTLVLALGGSAAWAVIHRRRTIPLGPGLVGGALLALAIARWFGLEAQ